MSVNTETSAQSKQTEHIFIDTYSMDCFFICLHLSSTVCCVTFTAKRCSAFSCYFFMIISIFILGTSIYTQYCGQVSLYVIFKCSVPYYLLILLNHGLVLALFALHQHGNDHSTFINMLLLFTPIYFYLQGRVDSHYSSYTSQAQHFTDCITKDTG